MIALTFRFLGSGCHSNRQRTPAEVAATRNKSRSLFVLQEALQVRFEALRRLCLHYWRRVVSSSRGAPLFCAKPALPDALAALLCFFGRAVWIRFHRQRFLRVRDGCTFERAASLQWATVECLPLTDALRVERVVARQRHGRLSNRRAIETLLADAADRAVLVIVLAFVPALPGIMVMRKVAPRRNSQETALEAPTRSVRQVFTQPRNGSRSTKISAPQLAQLPKAPAGLLQLHRQEPRCQGPQERPAAPQETAHRGPAFPNAAERRTRINATAIQARQ